MFTNINLMISERFLVFSGEETVLHHFSSAGSMPQVQTSKVKLHPNEAISILTLMTFDAYANYVHPIFRIRMHMWAGVSISGNLENLGKCLLETEFYENSWC